MGLVIDWQCEQGPSVQCVFSTTHLLSRVPQASGRNLSRCRICSFALICLTTLCFCRCCCLHFISHTNSPMSMAECGTCLLRASLFFSTPVLHSDPFFFFLCGQHMQTDAVAFSLYRRCHSESFQRICNLHIKPSINDCADKIMSLQLFAETSGCSRSAASCVKKKKISH